MSARSCGPVESEDRRKVYDSPRIARRKEELKQSGLITLTPSCGSYSGKPSRFQDICVEIKLFFNAELSSDLSY
jgi:hypothetical protein